MKNLIILGLLFSGISSTFAFSCTDLKVNLKRGTESKDVLALQNFLFEKKLLTAKPNGYFGPATLRAVQAYQKSVGLTNSGAVLTLTRAAIKKETCASGGETLATTTAQIPNSKATTTTITKTQTVKTGPAPIVTSLDKATVILGGETGWGVIIKGSNFSTTTNTVYLIRRDYSKRYTIGIFPSVDKKSITLPKSLGTLTFPCEFNCRQRLQEGEYFVVVETEQGGESQTNEYIVVKDSTITTSSVSQNAIPYTATGTRVGVFAFKANTPLTISTIKFNVDQGGASSTRLTNITFKDEKTGQVIANSGAGTALYEGEYKHIGVYANVETVKAVQAMTSFTVSILDAFGNKTTTLTSASTSINFQGEPSAITEMKRLASIAPSKITAVDRYAVLANGDTTWSVLVTGTDFSTTTNTVYLKARVGGRKYNLGVLPSKNNRTTIDLPKSLGNTFFSCGNDCKEKLVPGDYDLIVENGFGESNPYLLTVHSFNISARSGTETTAIQPRATGTRLGTVTFGTNTSLTLSSVRFNFSLYKNTSTISGTTLKDDMTGQALVNAGKDKNLSPYGTTVISAYANVSTTAATGGTGSFVVDVIEPVGKKVTTFTTPTFSVTLSSY